MMYQPPEEYDPNRADIPAGSGYPSSQPPTYQPGYPSPPPPPPAGQASYPPPPAFAYPPPFAEGRPPTGAYPPPPMQPPAPPVAYGAPHPAQTSQGNMAVVGLILGIISIPMAGLALCGFIFGVLGLIFSLQGRLSIRNHTWAVAGIVLSSVGLAASILHGFGFMLPGLF